MKYLLKFILEVWIRKTHLKYNIKKKLRFTKVYVSIIIKDIINLFSKPNLKTHKSEIISSIYSIKFNINFFHTFFFLLVFLKVQPWSKYKFFSRYLHFALYSFDTWHRLRVTFCGYCCHYTRTMRFSPPFQITFERFAVIFNHICWIWYNLMTTDKFHLD